jgi:outer membrane lipoprotein SlyB
MKKLLTLTGLAAALLLSSCAKNDAVPAGLPHAVVTMRDGTSVAGTVLSSSASEIQLSGDDKVTRTIPMSQVRSVDYGDAAAAAPPANAAPAAVPVPAAASAEAADAAHDQHYHPTESAITTKTYALPVGTRIPVRNEETIDSGRAAEGQTFAAEVTRDIRDSAGDVVIPRGSNARIIIRSASKGGHFRGASDLVMDLHSVSVDGRMYSLSTVDLVEKGRDGVGANKRTAEFAGGGAAVGTIIGALAGHGKGAAIGAGSGAGAGALTEILTKGTIKVPVESVLTFRLDAPLHVTAQ